MITFILLFTLQQEFLNNIKYRGLLVFINLNVPINIFGNSSISYDNGNKKDTPLFVQKPYLRTNYIEAIREEDIDVKNQFSIKNLTDPISIREAASKNYVDNRYNDSSMIKNNTLVDFNDKNHDKIRSIKVNTFPTIEKQLTPKMYVDEAVPDEVDESSRLRLDLDKKLRLDEQDSIVLNSTLTSPKTVIELPNKNYVIKKFNDPNITKNTANVDFDDKNLDNFRFVKVNSMPTVGEDLTAKYYVDKAIFLV